MTSLSFWATNGLTPMADGWRFLSALRQSMGPVFGTLLGALLAVWGAVSLVFIATRMIGDPTALLLPVGAGAEQLAALRQALGLDRPLGVQYLAYLSEALRGDFGQSFQHGRPAMELVLERLPATALLAAAALGLGVGLGLAAGVTAALSPHPRVRAGVMALSSLGQATPAFWLGVMLIMVFSVQLGWTPTGGRGGAEHLILPAATLALPIAAGVARLLRASLVEVLKEDHVRTARAKGLKPATIAVWHVLRNGLTPVLTLTGILAGELLGGAVVIETVFAWPGVGRLLIQSISARDFPVVQAAVLVIAVVYVVVNLVVDLLYARLDPRVRHDGATR